MMPRIEVRQASERSPRAALSPSSLQILSNELSEDPLRIWNWLRSYRSDPAASDQPPEVIAYVWLNILDDAYDYELQKAPPLKEYILNGIGLTVVIASVPLSLNETVLDRVGPLISFVVMLCGGAITLYTVMNLVRKDMNSNHRLRSIDQARDVLRHWLIGIES